MYTDAHCHLQLLDLDNINLDEIINNATLAQVNNLLCVATHPNQLGELKKISDKFASVMVSIGLHPNEEIDQEPELSDWLAWADKLKIVAIGETGLDYYRSKNHIDNFLDIKIKQQRFCVQIAAARELNKALIVHTRKAPLDTLEILKKEQASDVGGVLHCFTEDWDMAKKAMDLNFFISFSGIVTFKNAKDIQEVAKKVPLEHMLIETDAPYLAPHPYRGKTNQPSYVVYVAKFIAELKGISVDLVAKQTTENYFRLFKK